MYQSSLSDCVLGLRVALASGELLDIDERNPQTKSLLPAFRVSLGCLGVILSVRLKTIPARIMQCVKERMDVAAMQRHLAEWNMGHLFFKNWWFPATANGIGRGDVHLVSFLTESLYLMLSAFHPVDLNVLFFCPFSDF